MELLQPDLAGGSSNYVSSAIDAFEKNLKAFLSMPDVICEVIQTLKTEIPKKLDSSEREQFNIHPTVRAARIAADVFGLLSEMNLKEKTLCFEAIFRGVEIQLIRSEEKYKQEPFINLPNTELVPFREHDRNMIIQTLQKTIPGLSVGKNTLEKIKDYIQYQLAPIRAPRLTPEEDKKLYTEFSKKILEVSVAEYSAKVLTFAEEHNIHYEKAGMLSEDFFPRTQFTNSTTNLIIGQSSQTEPEIRAIRAGCQLAFQPVYFPTIQEFVGSSIYIPLINQLKNTITTTETADLQALNKLTNRIAGVITASLKNFLAGNIKMRNVERLAKNFLNVTQPLFMQCRLLVTKQGEIFVIGTIDDLKKENILGSNELRTKFNLTALDINKLSTEDVVELDVTRNCKKKWEPLRYEYDGEYHFSEQDRMGKGGWQQLEKKGLERLKKSLDLFFAALPKVAYIPRLKILK